MLTTPYSEIYTKIKMINKILVPLDGSASSEIVLPLAEAVAGKSSAGIILTTATGQDSQDLEPLYRSYLEKVKEKLRAHLRSHEGMAYKLDIHVLKGAPADEILRYSDEISADMIVMASRGSTTHGPWLLGSIATRVTVASTKPVLVVKNPVDKTSLDQGKLFQKILVPLDGSAAGEAALPFTEQLALVMGSELILFHAMQPAATWMGAGIGGTYAAIEIPENVKRVASGYLENLSKRLRAKGLNVKVVLQDGPAAELIVNYAKTEGVDVIAISTHGRTGISRWVFGSVTEKVLRYGDFAVLVVRASQL